MKLILLTLMTFFSLSAFAANSPMAVGGTPQNGPQASPYNYDTTNSNPSTMNNNQMNRNIPTSPNVNPNPGRPGMQNQPPMQNPGVQNYQQNNTH